MVSGLGLGVYGVGLSGSGLWFRVYGAGLID